MATLADSCDDCMVQVDTAFVGQTSNVALAALGPNTAIFNFVFQVPARCFCRPAAETRAHSDRAT